MTAGWTPETLSEIAGQEEIYVGSEPKEGGCTRWTPIWIVRVDDELYVRSGFGTRGRWYRNAVKSQAYIKASSVTYEVNLVRESGPLAVGAVDKAYRQKYATDPSLPLLLTDRARSSTSRVLPAT